MTSTLRAPNNYLNFTISLKLKIPLSESFQYLQMILAAKYTYTKAALYKPRGEQTTITHDRMAGGSMAIVIAADRQIHSMTTPKMLIGGGSMSLHNMMHSVCNRYCGDHSKRIQAH